MKFLTKNVEEWNNTELFTYLVGASAIHPDEKSEEWGEDRERMIELVKKDFEDWPLNMEEK